MRISCYATHMTYIRLTLVSLFAAACSTTASAQMVVLGSSHAAQCYKYVKADNQGSVSALQTCDDALNEVASTKNRAATFVNRGILHMRKGHQQMAISDYNAALKIKPDLTEAYVNLGASYIHQANQDLALDALNTALADEGHETRPVALANRAIVHDMREDYDAAYRDLKAAKALAPEWPLVDTLLARYTVTPRT